MEQAHDWWEMGKAIAFGIPIAFAWACGAYVQMKRAWAATQKALHEDGIIEASELMYQGFGQIKPALKLLDMHGDLPAHQRKEAIAALHQVFGPTFKEEDIQAVIAGGRALHKAAKMAAGHYKAAPVLADLTRAAAELGPALPATPPKATEDPPGAST